MRKPEFLERAGITFRQLDYWARAGYITPEGAETTSSDARSLAPDQVHEVRTLVAEGFTKTEIAERFHVSYGTVRDVVEHRRAYADDRDPSRIAEHANTPKSGHARLWTEAECAVAERMGRLVRAGIEVATAAEIARRPDEQIEIGPGVFVQVAPEVSR